MEPAAISVFLKEITSYSDDDLKLIFETQKDLYSQEEMALIEQEIERRQQEKQKQIIAQLPKEIICPKCDGPNPFENDTCQFCGYKFDKRKYYPEGWNRSDSDDNDYDGTEEESSSGYTFHYVISFLIPLIGFIIGAIFLGKDTEEYRSVGKGCILLGILSCVVATVIWALIINY